MLSHVVGSLLCIVVLLSQQPTEPAPTPEESPIPVEKWTYRQAGRRDPFEPLGLELGGSGMVSHLNVENLTLIGILWGDRGHIGLVKDGVGKGYILKPGDRVAGGKVSRIDNQGVTFEITHAGVVTKYELRLQKEERR
ncbi:hypothetical protein AMJ87_09735 [candidate division WOR_3 bacterium SM23_60]|uniref:Type II secretion system protein GspC N-terminal domain-containing protein n=1 Tax=candidate division WOR_3 bacterium SM23_60 TaxID=1703780 RepID=A0A0S8G9W8_UNCW3|nr:MAG: hypothetical protein AMJ87_09735 [candidate division WOR_3 bacterium SM23_60]